MDFFELFMQGITRHFSGSDLTNVSGLFVNSKNFKFIMEKEGRSAGLDFNDKPAEGEEPHEHEFYISEIEGDPSVMEDAKLVSISLINIGTEKEKKTRYEIVTDKGAVMIKWSCDDIDENGVAPPFGFG